MLPAWFGLGTALAGARERHGLELLREMASDWPFFATLLSNAEMGCARPTWRSPGATPSCGTTPRPRADLDAAGRRVRARSSELLAIRGSSRLLDREPVLQASIDRRNPFVDPLSFVQIELLRRLRERPSERREELGRVSLLTINGIASGLRNTG